MSNVITPEHFANQMKVLKEHTVKNEPVLAHIEADAYMYQILTQLGYGEGVKHIEDMDKMMLRK